MRERASVGAMVPKPRASAPHTRTDLFIVATMTSHWPRKGDEGWTRTRFAGAADKRRNGYRLYRHYVALHIARGTDKRTLT